LRSYAEEPLAAACFIELRSIVREYTHHGLAAGATMDKLGRIMRRLCVATLSLLVVLSASRASAWNETGHMTVAEIAWRQLSDGQRQRVAALLKTHPHYALYLNANRSEGVDESEWAFLRAAAWPDFVRPAKPGSEDEKFKGPEITHFHQGPWHYVTIPWVPPRERAMINPTTLPSRVEPSAIGAYDINSKLFAQADANSADRAVALAWIEHLVGDIHQPLHAASMFSSQYPTGDKGGNDQAIRPGGGPPMNLHSYWDGSLGTSDAYEAIAFLADQITGDPRLAPAKIPEIAKDTTFTSWADESYAWAGSLVYLNGRLRSVPWPQWQSKLIMEDEVPALPPSYAPNARALAERRVATAGYRLAAEIKRLLGE
jgi:hypothetical protein